MQLRAEGLDVLNAKIELVKRPAEYCQITSRLGATGYEGCSGAARARATPAELARIAEMTGLASSWQASARTAMQSQ
jgi:hypothetical protein